MLTLLSALCFALMAGALAALLVTHSVFSSDPLVIGAQAVAILLMLWARVVFGRRSFHATANPMRGGIVTAGPYHYIRHPIYTAACLFTIARVLAHRTPFAFGLAALVLIGAVGRMLAEETLLRQRYPEYANYAANTARMIPYVF